MSNKKGSTKNRKNNGQFESGTTIGSETRFAKFNKTATKYKAKYADMLLQFFNDTVEYPTFEDFAGTIGVSTETLRNWCKNNARFSACYERAKEIQRARLVRGALSGRYDSSFAKFFAQNCLDMVKKTEEEQEEKKPFDVNINIIPNPGVNTEVSTGEKKKDG